jgi:iron complex outermembrane receptor protein
MRLLPGIVAAVALSSLTVSPVLPRFSPALCAEDVDDREVVLLPPVLVTAPPPGGMETAVLGREQLESRRYTNLGEAILEVAGVNAVRRGASMTEPVIRGLGWERVLTQLNHLPIHGACPGRMDPPITYAHASSTQEIRVIKGVPSVTLGPAGTGGRIQVITDYERPPEAVPGLGSWLHGGYDAARDGWSTEGGVLGGNEQLDLRASLEVLRYGDYESGGGTEVPADQEEISSSLALAYRPSPSHRWWQTLNYVDEESIDYPSLPMDLDESTFWAFSGGYRRRPEDGRLQQLEAEVGFTTIDHGMSNRQKPNRGQIEAATTSESGGLSGLLRLRLDASESTTINAGVDAFHLGRDALRTRLVVASGQTFRDHIWPDASQNDLGFFTEGLTLLPDGYRLRAGARLDILWSDAEAVDEMSLGGRTIRENYVRFSGQEASDVADTEVVGSGNVLIEHSVGRHYRVHLGGGLCSRPAGVTERYYAFAPAPGGFQIGDPSLDPELKTEVTGGLDAELSWLHGHLTIYQTWIDDLILQTTVGYEDVNGDGDEDLIRGFRNVDARLYGGEASFLLRAGPDISFPLSLAYVRGENRSSGGDLPEIPPFEGSLAIRYTVERATPWWCEIGGRFVAEQERIDPAFSEDETRGFAVLHLRGGIEIGEALSVKLGAENLLDHEYNEHLTREAVMPAGDLPPGAEVPAPGFAFHADIRYSF